MNKIIENGRYQIEVCNMIIRRVIKNEWENKQ